MRRLGFVEQELQAAQHEEASPELARPGSDVARQLEAREHDAERHAQLEQRPQELYAAAAGVQHQVNTQVRR